MTHDIGGFAFIIIITTGTPKQLEKNQSIFVTMNITIQGLLLLSSAVSGFVVRPSTPSSTTTAMFDSRQRQKVAARTSWIEKRGGMAQVEEKAVAKPAAGLQTNEGGLEYVQLVHPSGSSSQVYLYGACVTSYIQDGTEFIAVRPDAKMDGSKPISGGLSHCWPQFGPGAIQQHGFARNVNWSVASMTDSSVELVMEPSDYTKEMWDKQFKCTFTVTLQEDQLDTKMWVENKGDDSFDFQAALHSYFAVSSLDKLEISGSFAGKEFLNKLVGDGGEMQTEDREVITISEEYDRVYKGVNDPVLKDAGTGKSLAVLNTKGWADTVIWSPYGNEGMGYNNFVCVESVKFDPVTLNGGETWVGDMSLKPSSN
jgi:glucose-6-phosphate 1-epimerase